MQAAFLNAPWDGIAKGRSPCEISDMSRDAVGCDHFDTASCSQYSPQAVGADVGGLLDGETYARKAWLG